MKRLPILAALLILTACTVIESPTPTAAPTPTSTASVTPPPTATITPSPTITQIIPTLDFLALPLADNFVFAPSADPDCQLPCWQGLRVGESDRDDIQTMFETVFGFDESVRFFEDESLIFDTDIPGTLASGYDWTLDYDEGGGFHILLLIDTETEILQGIDILFVRANFDIHNFTPQQIIMESGTPSYIFIAIEPIISTEDVASWLWLVYKEGIMFEFRFRIPTELRVQSGKEQRVVNYCLDKPVSSLGTVVFVAPFDDLWGDDLSLIQQRWIKDAVDDPKYVSPAEEVFGLTLAQIADVAHQEENPCIELDVTHLYE